MLVICPRGVEKEHKTNLFFRDRRRRETRCVLFAFLVAVLYDIICTRYTRGGGKTFHPVADGIREVFNYYRPFDTPQYYTIHCYHIRRIMRDVIILHLYIYVYL